MMMATKISTKITTRGESDNEEESDEESDDKESAGEFPSFAALWRDGQLCIARKLQPECAAPDHDAQFYNVKSRLMPKTLSKRVYLASWQKSQSGQDPGGDRGAVSEEVSQGIRSH